MKSKTCKGNNNQYLEEYISESAARFDAGRIKKVFDQERSPYLCRTCGYWHLRQLSHTRICGFCTDSALFQKDLYASKLEAEEAAARIGKKNKVNLFPYRCPHTSGWHLSKRKL